MKNKEDKRLYFAYGSNLRHSQIKKRCPHSRFISSAKIDGKRIAFTGYSIRWKGAPATILDSPESTVWGALFELDAHCVKRLDKFEGLTTHNYHHKLVRCIQPNGEPVEAYTYIRNRRKNKEGLPSSKYLSQIVKGANDCSLPPKYIHELEAILN